MKRIAHFALLAVVSITVAQAAQVFVPGYLYEEYWTGKLKGDVEGGSAGAPTTTTYLSTFEIPPDTADNYAVRVSGFFVPAVSGNYQFNVSADDTADLFLSTDDTAANKRMICQQPGWNATRDWTTDRGGNIAQRISATWVDASGATPFASGIPLVQGTHYYIEGVMNEFGGGDNFAVRHGLITNPAPWADGDPSNLAGNLIGVIATAPTTLTITTQPQNATAYVGTTARFTIAVQTDSVFPPTYQWRKGGVNITNATGTAYSFVASASDNGTSYDCVVKVPGITQNSSAATLTVPATGGLVVSGKLKHEFFFGASRQAVENGSVGAATFVSEFTSFHSPIEQGDSYTERVSGFFIPATTGNYVFFVSSDDDSDLFLSTDETPSKKRLIAQETNWSDDMAWTSSGGTSDLAQKRSDQWSPDGGVTRPYSGGIALTGGSRYYIEGVHHEGGGGDDFSATFKLLTDPDPADGTATQLTNGVIAYLTSPVTTGTITGQPQDVTVYESQPFSLSVTVQTDSELSPLYQWRKGGVNITNANGASYNVSPASTNDSGSYDCVATIPNSSITLTSSPATVTITPAPFATGYLKYEYFPLHSRPEVEAGTAGNPSFLGNTVGSDKSGATPSFESGVGFADNYANRFSGFFIPPTTGLYTFFVSGDDDSDLFLSTDDKPASKRMIAQVPTWSNSRQWSVGGQLRSDQWMDASGAVPFASGISLQGGAHYYIEGVHHEGGGGDNFAATYVLIGTNPDPVDGDAPRLTGNVIGIKVPPQPLSITQQPQNATNQEGRSVTFTIAATTTGFYPPAYQWKKGVVNIAGATSASYTTPLLTLGDNGAQFLCSVSIAGTAAINSQAATLTVVPDTFPPQITGAGTLLKTSGAVEIGIGFDEPLDPASAGTSGNYTLSSGTVTGARYEPYDASPFRSAVVLTTSGLSAGGTTTLTVTGVKDARGNAMPATQKPITATSKLKWAGIGGNDYQDGNLPADWDPSLVPANYYDDAVALGDKDFDLISGGSQNWNNYDEATFVYEQITGDFDRVVRVEYQDPSSQWARAGIMARKTLDEGVTKATVDGGYTMSQDMTIRVNPTVGWTNGVPGNNSYEWVWRDDDGGNYANSGGAANPAYPNAWMRMQRIGQTFTGYSSTDGVNWVNIGTHTFPAATPLPAALFVGPYYSPEMNNNGPPPTDVFFIGHSVVARFRDYAPLSTATRPVITSVSLSGGSVTVVWTGGGTLFSTTSLNPGTTWTTTTASNGSFTATVGTGNLFFRVQQ